MDSNAKLREILSDVEGSISIDLMIEALQKAKAAGCTMCEINYQPHGHDQRAVLSTVETLIDDEGNREKFTVMNLVEVMADDYRNDDMDFWESLDDFLQWGHQYRIAFEDLGP